MAPAACLGISVLFGQIHKARGNTHTTGSQVTSHPQGVAILVLLVAEQALEVVTEGEVQGLGREVSDDVGSVASPQGQCTLIGSGTAEAVHDTAVLAVETAGAEHLILGLDEELDTLDGGSSSLRDSGGDTTHYKSVSIYSSSNINCIESSH